jgi:hypothetical protein
MKRSVDMKKAMIFFVVVLSSIVASAAFASPYSNNDATGRPNVNIVSGTNSVKDEPGPKVTITNSSRWIYAGRRENPSKSYSTTHSTKNSDWTYTYTYTCDYYKEMKRYYIDGEYLLEVATGRGRDGTSCSVSKSGGY